MTSPKFFAGIDGGGSKTAAVVVDATGNVLGRGTAGPSNYQSIGLEKALVSVRGSLEAAVKAAGLEAAERPAGLVIGLAGNDRPEDNQVWSAAIEPLNLADQLELTVDVDLILYALPHSQGLGVISGTGSNSIGRDGRGHRAQSSGWGYFFGDEGSGFWLGREVLSAVSRAADGRGPQTQLLPLILQEWKLSQASDIIGAVYGHKQIDNSKIAKLAELVFKAEAAGDDHAKMLVKTAANELALAIKACDTRLIFDEPPGLALAGGLLLNHPTFQSALLRRLEAMMTLGPVVKVSDPALVAAQYAASNSRD